METGEPEPQRIGRQRQGKCTGVPIEESNNNNNNNDDDHISTNNNVEQSDGGKRNQDKKKLASIFNRSFFSKSSTIRFLESSYTKQKESRETVNVSENIGAHEETSFGDEWQLLEPEQEELDEMGDQNLKLTKQASTSDHKELNSIPINRNNNNNNNNDDDIVNDKLKNMNYVDIDPLDSRQRLNPGLIHLCTTLYALIPIVSLWAFVTLIGLLFTRYWPVTIAYFAYVILDRQTCNRGGRRWEAFYRAKFWTYLAAYFPIRLRFSKQFKLDPKENYILNYHPHGISAFGCVTSFATNGLNFSQLFPGITSRFLVHETSFCVPLMREIFGLRGDCSVNSKSIDFLLEKKWRQSESRHASGNLLALVGGGLAEADLSDPETLKIVVATRKGFVKKALLHGAHLVPCIAFGENSVFTKINLAPGSLLYKLQSYWYNLMKFKHPFYYGTSITGSQKLKGATPYRRPITVVIGDPIEVERVPEPTQQQVCELHERYLAHLRELYEANSDLCSRFDLRLEIV